MRKFDSSHLLALSRRRPTPHEDRCSAIPRSIECCNLISMPDCINSRSFWARHEPASNSPPTVSRPARLRPASLTPFPTRSAVSTPQTAGEGSRAHTATRSLMGFLVRTAEGCPVLAKYGPRFRSQETATARTDSREKEQARNHDRSEVPNPAQRRRPPRNRRSGNQLVVRLAISSNRPNRRLISF